MHSLDNTRPGSAGGSSLTRSPSGERHFLIRRAFVLEWLTLAWMLIEGIVAIAAAVGAHSLSLLAFGIDSLIELISASVLLWRLTIELQYGQAFSERAERTASRIGGGLLFALAFYVVVSAVLSFWEGRGVQLLLGAWWVDAATALAIVYFLVTEGREAWEDESCCEDDD